MVVPFSTGFDAAQGAGVRIALQSEENANATRRAGQVDEGKVKTKRAARRPQVPRGRRVAVPSIDAHRLPVLRFRNDSPPSRPRP
jgi:hypothetical protein